MYKQGQAGVTKASVSIVFDNGDKERSPVGYESFDEITVTRQVSRSRPHPHGRRRLPRTTSGLILTLIPFADCHRRAQQVPHQRPRCPARVRTGLPGPPPPAPRLPQRSLDSSLTSHPAPDRRVKNLFHSVQLNVNNPHFLIMQGRITKVLNMKPQEILSMLEEARPFPPARSSAHCSDPTAGAAPADPPPPDLKTGLRHPHVRVQEGQRPQDAREEAEQG